MSPVGNLEVGGVVKLVSLVRLDVVVQELFKSRKLVKS